MKIHILTDNRVYRRGLFAEHGLSLWIEKDDKKILFDLGRSSVFTHNAKQMNIDLKKADYVVISHGHYDHCGGLQYFLPGEEGPVIYAHPETFTQKLASSTGQPKQFREAGVPFNISEQKWIAERIVYNQSPLEVEKGIILSGEIPFTCSFEEAPENFYLKKNGELSPDLLLDEQMLIVEDAGEVAIFLGCSHRGVINSLRYAQKLIGGQKIKLLVAGMHLENVTSFRLQQTIKSLQEMNIQKVIPLHCTGLQAMCELKRALGEHCQLSSTGDVIEV